MAAQKGAGCRVAAGLTSTGDQNGKNQFFDQLGLTEYWLSPDVQRNKHTNIFVNDKNGLLRQYRDGSGKKDKREDILSDKRWLEGALTKEQREAKAIENGNENLLKIIDFCNCFPHFSALMRCALAKVHPHGLVRPLNQFKNAASKMVFGRMLAECLRDACDISGKPPAQPSHFFYTDS